eukprot:SAG11_NODE_4298_length_1965_cov_1.415863_1_plen_66_part_00
MYLEMSHFVSNEILLPNLDLEPYLGTYVPRYQVLLIFITILGAIVGEMWSIRRVGPGPVVRDHRP